MTPAGDRQPSKLAAISQQLRKTALLLLAFASAIAERFDQDEKTIDDDDTPPDDEL